MNRVYRYPARAVVADYARCIAGISCTLGPIWLLRPATTVGWVLGGVAALFFVYFGRTIVRNLTRIELDDRGIRARAGADSWIGWDDLCLVRLNYYTTTRDDRSGGWMQLELRGSRQTIVADSHLDGFAEIANLSARAAQRRGLGLDERTAANFRALGIAADADIERAA